MHIFVICDLWFVICDLCRSARGTPCWTICVNSHMFVRDYPNFPPKLHTKYDLRFAICNLWFVICDLCVSNFVICVLCFAVCMLHITQICDSKAWYIFMICDLCFSICSNRWVLSIPLKVLVNNVKYLAYNDLIINPHQYKTDNHLCN
jgi:hypothetical protein